MHEHPNKSEVKGLGLKEEVSKAMETTSQGVEWCRSSEGSAKARTRVFYVVPVAGGMVGKWKTDAQ